MSLMDHSTASSGDLKALINKMKSAVSPLRGALQELYDKYRPLTDGRVADYIPELAKADPKSFGISVVTVDGRCFDLGDTTTKFSMQSISKPFLFGMALQDHGREGVTKRVGVEPTGEAFNAIVLEEGTGRPFNPMVNAGAIATADLIEGVDFPDRIRRMLEALSCFAGEKLFVDNSIFMSERATGHRNRAMAHLMMNSNMITQPIEETLEMYFQQCSVLVTAHHLAVMAATLANGGVNPITQERAIASEYVKDILSVMLTCGMYDYSGEWAYRVGIPAKSGVGGGVLAVVPGQAGIAIFSPPLDAKGNSVRGIKVCEELAERYGLHVFSAGGNASLFSDSNRVRASSAEQS